MALPIGIELCSATISNGTALSGAVPLGEKVLVGIAMPAAWTAASLTFQVSVDGGTTWLELTDTTGSAVAAAVSASVYVAIDHALWRGINVVKVRSGTSSSPVNQGADRVVQIVTRALP